MIKEAFKQWKHELKEEHLQIKIQNKWFEELKNTDFYRQLNKYKWLRNSFILIDYVILVGCYLPIYTLTVSEINAFFGSHITKEAYQNIVFAYTTFIIMLALLFISFLINQINDKLKANRIFTNIMAFGLFGLVIVKIVIRKWKELQREAVFLSYKEAEKEDLIGHYNRHGIRFEMEDEPRIYRMDYFQEENKNEELRS